MIRFIRNRRPLVERYAEFRKAYAGRQLMTAAVRS
jgi:hypothetical protein